MSTLQTQLVKKTAIMDSGDFNLSASRYLEKVEINSVYEVVSIIDTFQLVKQSNKIKKNNYLKEGMIPIIDQSSDFIAGYTNDENGVIDEVCPLIIFGDHTRVVKFINIKFLPGADGVKILKPNIDIILPKFLYNILKSIKLKNLGYSRHFKLLKEVMIPLPPLEIQDQIVKEIEGYQQIIDGCRKVVNNYKPVIDIDPSWETMKLEDICEVFVDGDWIESKDQSENGIRLVQTGNIGFGFFKNKIDKARYISETTFKRLNCTEIFPNDILTSRLPDPVGKSCLIPNISSRMITGVDCTIIRTKKNVILTPFLLYYQMSEDYLNQVKSMITGTTRSRISRKKLGLINVPIPPIEEQKRIHEKIDLEKEVIEGNKKLIKIYEKKINDKIKELF